MFPVIVHVRPCLNTCFVMLGTLCSCGNNGTAGLFQAYQNEQLLFAQILLVFRMVASTVVVQAAAGMSSILCYARMAGSGWFGVVFLGHVVFASPIAL